MNKDISSETGKKFIISISPHLTSNETTRNIIWQVIFCLLPAAIFGIYAFGYFSLAIIVSCIMTSLLTEAVILKIRKKRISIDDGSAFLTGLLLALTMPPTVPLYIPIISSIFATGLVKQAFGGFGENWANPAIAARVFAMFAWSKQMNIWKVPFVFDTTASATPLGTVKSLILAKTIPENIPKASGFFSNIFTGPIDIINSGTNGNLSYFDLFFGFKSGCIGEISAFLLLIGAIYLIYKKIITLDIPASFLGTVILISWVFGGLQYGKGYFQGDFLFQLLTGGLVLGAFFMASDIVTTPLTTKGRIIFGAGCGIITMLIRMFGSLSEGVCLAILFMNMLTPMLNRYIKIKPMGYIKQKKVKEY